MSAATDSGTETVYVRLMDEGTDVWRPTQAEVLGNGKYRLLAPAGYDAELETWEFLPGSTVVCGLKKLSGNIVLAAVRAD